MGVRTGRRTRCHQRYFETRRATFSGRHRRAREARTLRQRRHYCGQSPERHLFKTFRRTLQSCEVKIVAAGLPLLPLERFLWREPSAGNAADFSDVSRTVGEAPGEAKANPPSLLSDIIFS